MKRDPFSNGAAAFLPLEQLKTAIASKHDIPNIAITSNDYRLIHQKELSSATIHPIPQMADPGVVERIENEVQDMSDEARRGISVRFPFLPWLFLLAGILLWLLPGLLQWLGGEDRNWASIINQTIGTGSVLVGVVVYVARRIFRYDNLREAILKGRLFVKSDTAARFMAPRVVRLIKAHACDPKLPSDLLAQDCSSAVRVRLGGWLSVKNIPVEKAHENGYHILMDKGIALDLIAGKLFRTETTSDGNERILRRTRQGGVEWRGHTVKRGAKIV